MVERMSYELMPGEAVADAVLVAIFRLLDRHGGISVWKDQKPEFGKAIPYDIEFITRLATKGGCRQACDHVITFLKERHGELFERLVLIEALSCMDEPLKNGWGWHDYFLVLGIDGVWYSGSPANYQNKMEGYEGEMLTVISSPNLDEVMGKIEEIEGGRWPDPLEIKKILFVPPDEVDGCIPIIYNQSGDTIFRWYKRPV